MDLVMAIDDKEAGRQLMQDMIIKKRRLLSAV